jgi:hypothetical protein
MSRDLAASHFLGTNDYSSVCRESASAISGSLPVIPAEREASLIMGRLVREYWRRRPIEDARLTCIVAHALPRLDWQIKS